MNTNILAKGFENWINRESKEKVSVVVDYRDEQTLAVKAYHKVYAELVLLGIHNSMSYKKTLLSVEHTYNHGVTTEDEAREAAMTMLLEQMFSYCKDKGKIY